MFPIATAEFTMLLRNRLVAACAIFIPLAFGACLLFNPTAMGGAGAIAVLQLLVMVAMGVYVTATTTLAARRQTLFLKRLRSGAVSDGSIITGLIAPIVIISVIQIAIIMTVLGITSDAPPAHAWLLIIAVLATEAMFTGFALATAGVTTSPEHAQITTLPVFFLTLAVAFWVLFTGTEMQLVKRLLPGGAVTELTQLAWNGGDLSDAPMLIGITLAWAVIAGIAAKIMFRWEPRS